jgi:hypothetical protein
MSREYEDLFKKLKDLTNVAIDQIMTNENNTIEDLEAGRTMLVNVSYSIREALEQGVHGSNVMRSAIDSIISEKYLQDTGQELDFNSEDRPDVILAWLEPKGSDYKYAIKDEAVKKLQQTAKKLDFLIKKADEGIAAKKEGKEETWKAIKFLISKRLEPVLEKKQGKMAQDDFNKLLEEMKNEKKDGQYLFFEPKGWSKKGVAKSFPRKKGGRRTRKRKRRRRTKKKRRKRNLKKRTKRRRRSKRRRRR